MTQKLIILMRNNKSYRFRLFGLNAQLKTIQEGPLIIEKMKL